MLVIQTGREAPEFDAAASDGRRVTSAGLRGRPYVLYFFPKVGTPVCSLEAQGFRDRYSEVQALGAEVVGVSTDELSAHCEFGGRESVPFPLVADPTGAIAKSFGVLWPLIRRARRVTFVVDERGVVECVIRNELSADRHVDGALEHLRRRAPAVPA